MLLLSSDALTVAASNSIDRGTRRVCGICGGTAAECLCCSQVQAFDAEMITDSTVKQEALSREQWIRWSHGLPLDEALETMPIVTIGDNDEYRGSGRIALERCYRLSL